MNTSELFLASFMLAAPIGTPETVHESEWPRMSVALRQVATEWELLDPREHKYFFDSLSECQSDIDDVRKRRVRLASAPTLAELRRLPTSRDAAHQIDFNKEYGKHLARRLAWERDRAGEISVVIRENERLGRIWGCVLSAQAEYDYVWSRRECGLVLQELLAKQGLERYELPPSVPLWAFGPWR